MALRSEAQLTTFFSIISPQLYVGILPFIYSPHVCRTMAGESIKVVPTQILFYFSNTFSYHNGLFSRRVSASRFLVLGVSTGFSSTVTDAWLNIRECFGCQQVNRLPSDSCALLLCLGGEHMECWWGQSNPCCNSAVLQWQQPSELQSTWPVSRTHRNGDWSATVLLYL